MTSKDLLGLRLNALSFPERYNSGSDTRTLPAEIESASLLLGAGNAVLLAGGSGAGKTPLVLDSAEPAAVRALFSKQCWGFDRPRTIEYVSSDDCRIPPDSVVVYNVLPADCVPELFDDSGVFCRVLYQCFKNDRMDRENIRKKVISASGRESRCDLRLHRKQSHCRKPPEKLLLHVGAAAQGNVLDHCGIIRAFPGAGA